MPNNPIADAALRELRAFGVDTKHIVRAGGRTGIYFLETGAGARPSLIVYDRSGSSMATARSGDFRWNEILQEAEWLHISGITPGISATAADLTLEAGRAANECEVKVSCDLNYRQSLWNYGVSPRLLMGDLMRYVDICIAGREDCQRCLGIGSVADHDLHTVDLEA